MPQFKEIPAGAYDPSEVAEVSEDSLREAVDAAREVVDEIRAAQYEIRQTTPKPKLLDALAESDVALQDAIRKLNHAERALGRFLRTNENPQVISVGTASESSEAGGVE